MNENLNILVVEDDENIRDGLIDILESENFQVKSATNGLEAIKLLNSEEFNLVLLDIMIPHKNGYDVCREFRQTNQQTPVIMLTAKGEEIDKVVGLEIGADDYITKPFGIHELLARINAVLRRCKHDTRKKISTEYQFGSAIINTKEMIATTENKQYPLSIREVKLLNYFYERPGAALAREKILNAIWGYDYQGTTRTLDQHIAQLRKKIETNNPATKNSTIQTIYGFGYKYNN